MNQFPIGYNMKDISIEAWCESIQTRFSQLNATLDWGKKKEVREALFRMQIELDRIKTLAKQAKEEEQMTVHANSTSKVNHPSHYNQYGIECKDIIKRLSWNQGCPIKYVWRCGLKDESIQELEKAIWHLTEMIEDNEAVIVEVDPNLVNLFVTCCDGMEDWKKQLVYLMLNNEFAEAINDIHKVISLIHSRNQNSHLHG